MDGAFQVVKLLSRRPMCWEQCLILARLKFDKYFKRKVKFWPTLCNRPLAFLRFCAQRSVEISEASVPCREYYSEPIINNIISFSLVLYFCPLILYPVRKNAVPFVLIMR